MFQNQWLMAPLALSLFALNAASSGPLQAQAHHNRARASVKPPNEAGEAFRIIVPTELRQKVTMPPSWLPLSKQMALLQSNTSVPLTRAPSIPDDPIFVAASSRDAFVLLRQMRLLLTDEQWQCHWFNKDLEKGHHAYRLWREAVSPLERRARMAQAAKDRLAKVLALLAAGSDAWNAARQEDPDLSNALRQPIRQAPLLLAGQLSAEQLDGVLMGHPLNLSVASLSPQDQVLVRQSLTSVPSGNLITTCTNNLTGESRVIFNVDDLLVTGNVRFEASPLMGDPGSLELALHVSTEPADEFEMGSNGMLYVADADFAQDEKQQIEAQHRQEAAETLAAQTPGAKTVTIDAATSPQPGEPQMAAYLCAFATQTGLTVLAHWPKDSQEPESHLPASIVNLPAGEALDILCKTYNGEWVQDETVIRLRARQQDAKKPSPSTPAPTTSSSLSH